MDNPLDNLIGLYCIKAYSGFAGQLKIKCHNSFDPLTLLSDNFKKPGWYFETGSAAWRLSENGAIQTGAFEEAQHKDTALKALIGKKVVAIKKNNATDFSLIFQDNFTIDTFHQAVEYQPLKFCNMLENIYLFLSTEGNWYPQPDSTGFTDDDELQHAHSEQAHKRWEQFVPRTSFDNNCRNCAYFIPSSGRYYFWDYGVCSHKNSVYDGQVVGVNSTCEYFDFESDE